MVSIWAGTCVNTGISRTKQIGKTSGQVREFSRIVITVFSRPQTRRFRQGTPAVPPFCCRIPGVHNPLPPATEIPIVSQHLCRARREDVPCAHGLKVRPNKRTLVVAISCRSDRMSKVITFSSRSNCQWKAQSHLNKNVAADVLPV